MRAHPPRALAAWRQPAVLQGFQACSGPGSPTTTLPGMLRLALHHVVERRAPNSPTARMRGCAPLVGSQLAGIALLRFMIGVEALAEADDETIIAAVGPHPAAVPDRRDALSWSRHGTGQGHGVSSPNR